MQEMILEILHSITLHGMVKSKQLNGLLIRVLKLTNIIIVIGLHCIGERAMVNYQQSIY